MLYQISREGKVYGPYTLDDLQRYVASGNVLLSDMAKSEEMAEWLPVSEILGAGTPPTHPPFYDASFAAAPGRGPSYPDVALAASQYPDAPNLHWGLVLLFAFLTCSLFMFIWNIIIAAWLKRVQPNATSMFYYVGSAVLLVIQVFFGGMSGAHHGMETGSHHFAGNPFGALVAVMLWVVRLVARYSQRASLLEHFNGPEAVGLRLNPVMTFFFGGIYFQHHLNRIKALKQAARFGTVRAY